MNIGNAVPGQVLYRKVRIAFISKGTTLGAWCKAHDINAAAARAALIGGWNGKGGRDLRARLIKASGADIRQHHAA